jgi:hypothetical protein
MSLPPCPRCGHVRPPLDPHPPGRCSKCGFVPGRDAPGPPPAPAPRRPERVAPARGPLALVRALLLPVPDRVDLVAFCGRCAALLLVVLWGAWFIAQDWTSDTVMTSFLHRPDLAFHEFGHLLFGPFGQWMMFLGGSLFQCFVPAALVVYFVLVQRRPFSAAICLWWLGQNFMDLAPYIADAKSMAIPLVGEWNEAAVAARSLRHDWHNILRPLGLLDRSMELGHLAGLAASATMILAWLWGGAVLWLQYPRLSLDYIAER